jgi:hypothetical protein
MAADGGVLYFSADDGFHGRELWALRIGGRRGDANGDSVLDLADPITVLACLFLGGECPAADCAADANGDGRVDLSDPIFILEHLFLGGPAPGPCEGGRA